MRSRPKRVAGLVTSSLYRGRAHATLGSRFESLGIATEFMPSVLVARMIEGGLRYGLGSTLAVSREALEKIGGFEALVDYLADDYELGERIYKAGYRIALSAEVVETSVPAYAWRGFCDHQLRWLRTVRDARPGGYAGLLFTQGFTLAVINLIASGISPVSLWLFALGFFLRISLAMTVGRRSAGRSPGAAQSAAAASARPCRDRPVDRGLRRQYHRLARRAVHCEGRQAEHITAVQFRVLSS